MQNPNHPSVFKGMRRLRYADIREELSDARRSHYYWWFEYLKLSKDYWWVCKQQGNTLDADLKGMWEDFGDISNTIFDNWWINRGRMLFAEQLHLPKVRKINGEDNNLNPQSENYLVVEIPLNMTERTISRQVLGLLRAEPNRQIKRVSHAKRPLAKLIGIRQSVITDAYSIWSLNQLVQTAKMPTSNIGKPFDTMTSQEIGIFFRLVRSCMPKYTDSEEVERKKRNGMKVAVSRMLQRADALIANAEIGIYPSFSAVAKRVRWTPEQQVDLDNAVMNGFWSPCYEDESYFRRIIQRPKLPG